MVKNLLLKVSEEHCLKLKRLSKKYKLTMYELMDIITARTNELEMFLDYLVIKNRKDTKEDEFFRPDVKLEVKYPTKRSRDRRRIQLRLGKSRG